MSLFQKPLRQTDKQTNRPTDQQLDFESCSGQLITEIPEKPVVSEKLVIPAMCSGTACSVQCSCSVVMAPTSPRRTRTWLLPSLKCTVSSVHCTVSSVHCTLQCTVGTVHCALYMAVFSRQCVEQCTVGSVHSALQSSWQFEVCTAVQCTVGSVHYSLQLEVYTVQ